MAAQPASQLTDAVSGDLTDAVSSGAYANEPARFAPGDFCGTYRIVNLLGRGGMGEVYEAVGADGRRVALKLLRERLTSNADRERFLREGVLAASVTHRNCVYVYGSEEVDGLPVIAMELAPQGTLKQAIAQFGPRTPVQAVNDILQVVDGLEAAAAAGILHRDVKPSNCFIDADGGIKVGDFGLSLSLNPADGDVAWKPTFQGTPEYAAPEQLRAEPLDLRADIYSVGATLFFLLTGYSPFGERNIQKLIKLKTTQPPVTTAFLPDIPKGLSLLVGRCMSPDPNRRPQTYKDLREQLLPFVTEAPLPSSMIRRFGASMLDSWITGIFVPFMAAIRTAASPEIGTIVVTAFSFVAYTLFDRYLGGTPGKLIAGIRVTDPAGRHPSLAQAAARWALGIGLLQIIVVFQRAGILRPDTISMTLVPAGLVFLLSSAVYARFRPGNTMFHDWWTGTRVVRWNPASTRTADDPRSLDIPPSLETTPAGTDRVGPFEIIGRLRAMPAGDLLLARDARLRRFVWIRRHSSSLGPLPAARRQLSLSTRLRWLAGDDTWDAFEAPEGRAFARHGSEPGAGNELASARFWLSELSRDLEAAEAVGELPWLSLDRLWVLSSGRIMLLDFEAPGAGSSSVEASASAPLFLAELAKASGLTDSAPISSRLVVDALAEAWMTTRAAAALLQKHLHESARVNRWRRAFPILVCTLAPVVHAGGIYLEARAQLARFERPNASRLLLLDDMSPIDKLKGSANENNLLRTYAADPFRADIAADRSFWSSSRGRQFSRYRPAIEHVIKWSRPLSAAETEAARAIVDARFRTERDQAVQRWNWRNQRGGAEILGMSMMVLLAPLAVCSILVSLVSTPFLFRVTNQSLFDNEGLDPGLGRRFARAAITWSPLLLVPLNVWLALALLAAGAIYAIASPERSLQDRLAGTFVAPR